MEILIDGVRVFIEVYREHGDPKEFESAIKDSLERNFRFYQSVPSTVEKMTVQFLYTRSEYDALVGRPTGQWASGYSKGSSIYMFDLDVFDTETAHSRSDFFKTLTHEMSHMFTRGVSSSYLWWVTEGIALYIAGQFDCKPIEQKNIDRFLGFGFLRNEPYKEFYDAQGYQIAKRIAYFVATEKGEMALLNFLQLSRDTATLADVALILNIPVESIDSTIREWLSKDIPLQ